MPSYKEAFPSRWLKAEDCEPPLILTIQTVGLEDVGSGTNVERKLVVRFVDRTQGWVLNVTNAKTLENMFGTDDYDEWVGSRICLVSVKVQFKNETKDGIRVQAVPTRKPRPPVAPPTPQIAAATPPTARPTPRSVLTPAVEAVDEPAIEELDGPETEVGF